MIESARAYHDETSYDRHNLKGRHLDWGSQPNVFKAYPGLKSEPLPKIKSWPDVSLSSLFKEGERVDSHDRMDLNRLSRILSMTHALTAKIRQVGGDFYFRSIASAGALYPFELYVATVRSDGLQDGLYHHNAAQQGLTLLRTGTVLTELEQDLRLKRENPPVLVFFLSAIFYRSSWKYRDRAYRYHLLDTGHMAENLAMALRAEGMAFRLHYDFHDERVNGLLGLDSTREVCLAVVPVWDETPAQAQTKTLEEPVTDLARASQVAAREIDHPMIRQIHEATCKPSQMPCGAPDMMRSLGVELQGESLVSAPEQWPEVANYVESVMQRRSMRNFVRSELPANCMAALLTALLSEPMNRVHAEPIGNSALAVGFLAGKIEGLAPGFYLIDRETRSIRLASPGFFMEDMAYACLNQAWLAHCAVHFLFLTNLAVIEEMWGCRAYRHVLLTAGRLGQRLYLTTTSMRLGCCGIGAYYDNEAARVLALNDQSRLLYLVAAGPVTKYTGI